MSNLLLDEDFTDEQYQRADPQPVEVAPVFGEVQPISGGGTGATTAPAARASLGAAASGANADITSMSALTGNTGFANWTGTADGTTHATYPTTTASVAYTQAEIQGLMDKMKETTETVKKIIDALKAWGGLEA